MSNMQQSHNAAGQSHGHNQAARAEAWVQSNKDHSSSAHLSGGPNASSHSALDSSHHGQPQLHRPVSQSPSADTHQPSHDSHDDNNSGFLQQTGEQVMHMAQGAVDTVKNTLGMGPGDNNNKK